MRSYTEKQITQEWWVKPLKFMISVIISFVFMFLMILVFSTIIAKTGMPESSEQIIMIIISALTSLLISIFLVFTLNSKGILCAVYSFAIIFLTKILLTEILIGSLTFGKQGIIGIVFTAVFCFLGGLIGSNIKK